MNEFLELQYDIESCELESKMLYDVDSYMYYTYKTALYEGGGYDDEVIQLLYEKAVYDHIEKKKGILRRMVESIQTFISKFITHSQVQEIQKVDVHEIDKDIYIDVVEPGDIKEAFNRIMNDYNRLWQEAKGGKVIPDSEIEKVEAKFNDYEPNKKKTGKWNKIKKGISLVSLIATIPIIVKSLSMNKEHIKNKFNADNIKVLSKDQMEQCQKILKKVSTSVGKYSSYIKKYISLAFAGIKKDGISEGLYSAYINMKPRERKIFKHGRAYDNEVRIVPNYIIPKVNSVSYSNPGNKIERGARDLRKFNMYSVKRIRE